MEYCTKLNWRNLVTNIYYIYYIYIIHRQSKLGDIYENINHGVQHGIAQTNTPIIRFT